MNSDTKRLLDELWQAREIRGVLPETEWEISTFLTRHTTDHLIPASSATSRIGRVWPQRQTRGDGTPSGLLMEIGGAAEIAFTNPRMKDNLGPTLVGRTWRVPTDDFGISIYRWEHNETFDLNVRFLTSVGPIRFRFGREIIVRSVDVCGAPDATVAVILKRALEIRLMGLSADNALRTLADDISSLGGIKVGRFLSFDPTDRKTRAGEGESVGKAEVPGTTNVTPGPAH
jgi:hypothetical protein